jgi:hypothetical protein
MGNLPDAWVEDARNLDNAEQLLHSAHGILLETPAIGDFLRNETNKRIVVAPKGYGKTFLLSPSGSCCSAIWKICRACRTINWWTRRFPTARACRKPTCSVSWIMRSGARFGRLP